MFLDRDEIVSLTGRRRRDAQVRELNTMGVDHKVRSDGSIAVMRAHVERLFGAAAPAARTQQRRELVEPDWS